MRLGSLLIREGRLTQSQLDAAVSHQARNGGKLGTALVEMRAVDVDTLTVYLGLALGIPIATNAALGRAKRSAVSMLTPNIASRFHCVPLVIQDRQLVVAMEDPLDLVALDELSSITGYRIIPRVAAEVRLAYYIERYYGVPRDKRHVALGELVLVGHDKAADALAPPPLPLPGLPPVSDAPAAAPRPAHLRAVPTEADDLAEQLQSDGGEQAEKVPKESPVPPAEVHEASQRVAMPDINPLSTKDALEAIEEASSRGDVADALIAFAANHFDIAVLFVVRSEMAFGWRGYGPDLDTDRIETLLIPLGPTSIFSSAIATNDIFVGAAPPNSLHAHLFKILRVPAPAENVVIPIMIRDRIVNVLYGQKGTEGVTNDDDITTLGHVASAAGDAYVRLIGLHKTK